MTVLRASNAPIGLYDGKPVSTVNNVTPWTRPSDWVTFTPPSPSEQKVIGTVAVFNQDSNYLAVNVTITDGTQYTVDWGDGTTTNHNSGTTAEKNYVWGDISSGTVTSKGYRQAIVTITPTTAGKTFSNLSLSRLPTGVATNTNGTSPWLDVAISSPSVVNVEFAFTVGGTSTSRLPARMLENVLVISTMSSFGYLFSNMTSLQNVNISTNAPTISAVNMFQGSSSLRTAPALPPIRTTMINMFQGCSALQYVPLYDIAPAGNQVTNMQGTFNGCSALESVPLFNTSFVTNFSSTFSQCSSLKAIPKFNFTAAQNFASMFSGCLSLEEFPETNTGSFLSNTSGMFNNCPSLTKVGLFNISGSGANVTNMFTGCSALEEIPNFNISTANSISNMFSNCTSLQVSPVLTIGTGMNTANGLYNNCRTLREISELDLTYINSVSNNPLNLGNATANNATSSLGRAKLIGNKFTQTFQNCNLGATELDEMYTALATLNPAITNVSGNGTTVTVTVGTANIRPFVAGRSVTITGVDPVAYNISGTVAAVNNTLGTFTISNAATGTYVSGGIASITSDRTITVTGNPGTTGDDPTIATNKGWTVTG